MRDFRNVQLLIVATSLTLLGGCGLNIDLTGPASVVPGQQGTFQAKLSNVSACPLFDPGLVGTADFVFAAFVPRQAIEGSPLFAEVCGLSSPSRFAASSSGLATASAADVGLARSMFDTVAAQAAAATCSGPGAVCESFGDTEVLCDTGNGLGVGQMVTLTCEATAPAGTRPVYSLAVSAMFAAGVCTAGSSSPGAACGGDADCGGDTNSCGQGICTGGSNPGNGCAVDGDCPGGTCTTCAGDFALGIACLASDPGAAPAPALAPWGLAGALASFGGIAFWRLRRRG